MHATEKRRRRWDPGNVAIGVAAASALGFLYGPIITLMMFSFNDNPITKLPLTSWTLKWYYKALTNPDLLAALWNSVIVATAAVIICLVIGIPTAFALDRFDFRGKTIFRRLVILPITLPGIITGVSILVFFSMVGVKLSLWTVIVGHGTALTAIVVTIRSAVIGSSLIAFTVSFDEIPVTYFLTGRDNTLPMYIWSVVRRGITPEINAIGTIIVAFSIVLIFVSVLMIYDGQQDSGSRRRN